jgi:hypothetical protein
MLINLLPLPFTSLVIILKVGIELDPLNGPAANQIN